MRGNPGRGFPAEEGVIQVEMFGMHFPHTGCMIYGLDINAIMDRVRDSISLDLMSRLLVDVHNDSRRRSGPQRRPRAPGSPRLGGGVAGRPAGMPGAVRGCGRRRGPLPAAAAPGRGPRPGGPGLGGPRPRGRGLRGRGPRPAAAAADVVGAWEAAYAAAVAGLSYVGYVKVRPSSAPARETPRRVTLAAES